MTPTLCALFFLSGASALIFETVWFRQTGLVFGSSIWATTLVLSSFMGGLALGNALCALTGHRLVRPIRAYAGLEIVVAAMGLGLVLLLPKLTELLAPVFHPMLGRPWLLNPTRFGLSFLLLLVPTTAMGATLPILTKALFARDAHFGKVLGRLYGWNTLGAVTGAFASEGLLIGSVGVAGAGLTAAGLNGVAAAVALLLSFTTAPPSPTPAALAAPVSGQERPAGRALLAAAFLSGAVLLALEVVWFRFLLHVVIGSSLAFAAMLSVVLAGIGAGGLLGAAWLRADPAAQRHLPALALACGGLTLLPYAGFDSIVNTTFGAAMQKGEVVYLGDPLSILVLALPLMLPTSLFSGLLFTLIAQAAKEDLGSDIRTAGLLTLANTTGGMIGSLVGGFLLLPWLGMERSLFTLALCYGAVALCVFALPLGRASLRWHGPVPLATAGAGFLLLLLLFPAGKLVQTYLLNPIRPYLADGMRVVALRETPSETLVYLRKDFLGEPYHYRMLTNGFGMASNRTFAARYMKLFVYWPVALHPDPRSALLISYGLGSTAEALTDSDEFETIDFVEISPEVLAMSALVHPQRDPVQDPRVTTHVEDGRFFLQTTDRSFDVITGEPPPPKSAGVVNLYSREYFELVHDRLNEGGITTYWLPLHLVDASDARAIVRAFCDVFADCSLWAGTTWDWMLVGTRGASGPGSEARFLEQWNDPEVAAELRSLGLERPEQLGALFLADASTLRSWTADTPPLLDDRPHRVSMALADPRRNESFVRSWTDAAQTRRRFEESEFVRRLWPESMYRKTLAYFDQQQVLNQLLLSDLARQQLDEEDLHRVLSESSLRAPVLWMLGSDDDQQSILARVGDADGEIHPAARQRMLGVGALANRDYATAAERFRRGLEEAPGALRLASLRVFALCMAGRLEEAEEIARSMARGRAASPAEREYWARLERIFGLPDPYRTSG